MSIILFIGLPGSGKSYWMKKICDVVIDDITDLSSLGEYDELSVVGISDVNFCDYSILKKAKAILEEKYHAHSVELFYFENNAEKCRKNVEYRKKKGDYREVEGTIRRFEKIYNPPSVCHEIWVAPEKKRDRTIKETIQKMSTRELMNMRFTDSYYDWQWDRLSEERQQEIFGFHDALRVELATREHVPNKAEGKAKRREAAKRKT